jgi:hypothetical protein
MVICWRVEVWWDFNHHIMMMDLGSKWAFEPPVGILGKNKKYFNQKPQG